MRTRSRILAALAFFLVGLAASGWQMARAQPGQGGNDSPVTGGLKRHVNLPPDQLAKEAEATQAKIEMVATTIDRMYRKARDDERDPTKALCLREKLIQAEVALRSAKERKSLLDDALKNSNIEQANHDFQVLQSSGNRAEKLRAQAQTCIGSDIGILGTTTNSSIVDPDIPDDQTGVPPGGGTLTGFPGVEVQVPTCMSPPCN